MDDEIDRLVVRVRADTSGLERDVAGLRATIEGPLEAGAERAGRAIEASLLRAVRGGQLGFEDLRRSALSVLDGIAAAAVRSGIGAIVGGGAGGLAGALAGIVTGVPGRATGGPVSPGRAYRVGERGPELFVPTTSGTVVANAAPGPREVRLSISVDARAGEAPAALAQSARQVARAVRAALQEG